VESGDRVPSPVAGKYGFSREEHQCSICVAVVSQLQTERERDLTYNHQGRTNVRPLYLTDDQRSWEKLTWERGKVP
jgi:hypothetical protein